MSAARDVVEVIARELVDHPESVHVVEGDSRDGVRVSLTTGPGDLGKMIGRQGRTASAVRVLAEIAAEREGQLVIVDFDDERDE
ncbi:MAG: KH domain-containing protein [Acidobacteriota bacterium]|nr:KH domain-containing protein [Acidobacteriota bacterium]